MEIFLLILMIFTNVFLFWFGIKITYITEVLLKDLDEIEYKLDEIKNEIEFLKDEIEHANVSQRRPFLDS